MRGWRVARRVATVVAVGALAAGCAVGPAAHRADQEAPRASSDPSGDGSEDPDPGRESGETGTPPEESEQPAPEPEPAPARGSAEIAETPAEGLGDGLCCVAELPDGDLLVGSRATGAVSRVSRDDGTTTGLGTVQGGLLGLAVRPAPEDADDVTVFAYVTQSAGSRVVAHRYYPGRADGQQWGSAGGTLLPDLPLAEARNGGALAFGPDGMLYVGTGDAGQPGLATDGESQAGKVLRMEPDGGIPDDNPTAGSYVYSSGHADVRGLAWDGDRLWALDAGAVQSIVPGGEPRTVWEPADGTPTALAAAAGSLWVPDDADRLWRLPLDGTSLVAEPQPLLEGELTGADGIAPAGAGLWALAGGALHRLDVS
ncbi:PQQ-dependent sugar dehydrogenase [Streptomyces sp. NBC_01803]|uniref:PQQ-dependent sugar dehydrogenase n=1 Tax=Streptomyces sp. NBC_01803 TaxID=2975946 RepID=UPI002DDA1171|nr:PQQ-dependent sugar dehydrogenase [Streptomyces sp. NBC_01803]WSA44896.1 PQQ-dependent sugar dehydrogenase [Streptomyces sp. NBC_01803]